MEQPIVFSFGEWLRHTAGTLRLVFCSFFPRDTGQIKTVTQPPRVCIFFAALPPEPGS